MAINTPAKPALLCPRNILLTMGLASLLLASCTSLGPHTIRRDRPLYTDALGDATKTQMLMNIIKLRYGDAPVFLEVASVINSYSIEGGVGLSASKEDINNYGLIGSTSYIDRPTITYLPLTGEEFTRSLLTPIQPAAIFGLIQAGWPLDRVLRLCVSAINGVYNNNYSILVSHAADPEFEQMMAALERVHQNGNVGMRVGRNPETNVSSTVMFFRRPDREVPEQDLNLLKQLLGLDKETNEFFLEFGKVPSSPREIAVLTRSMMQILGAMSMGVEAPLNDVEQGRTVPNIPRELRESHMAFLNIKSSEDKPEDAFISVQYRGYWFWIADNDLPSKRMLTFSNFLFSLAKSSTQGIAPVITVPAL